MAAPLYVPRFRAFTQAGVPMAGGKLYTYVATTSTPQATYTDATLLVANANPVVLDANGEAAVWIGPAAYKFILKDASDVTQWTVDNVTESGSGETPAGSFQPIGVFYDAGNSATALSIDWANGQQQQFTLTGNATITLGDPTVPGWYTLKILQDATGGRTLAWAGTHYSASRWINAGAAPTLSPVISAVEFVSLFWDGSVWYMRHDGPVARKDRYVARVYRGSSNQTTTLNVRTKVQWNATDVDPYTEWDVATNYRWTPKVTGLYLVQLTMLVSDASAASVIAEIAVAGSAAAQGQRTLAAGVADPQQLTHVLNVTSLGQYVEAFLTSNTGAGTVFANQTTTFMQIVRLGDAQ